MGYITIEVECEGIDRTWNFFYGEYIDDRWAARLADHKLKVFQRFEADSIEECFDLLIDYLRANAVVIDIFGSKIERHYIDMIMFKMDLFGNYRVRPYF